MPDFVTNLAFVVALALSVFNLWDRIDARVKASKEPTKVLETRIDALETIINAEYKQRFIDYDSHFKADLQRIEQIEEGNKVTQKALLALLSHAIDGNNTEQLKKAENDLTQYLIDR